MTNTTITDKTGTEITTGALITDGKWTAMVTGIEIYTHCQTNVEMGLILYELLTTKSGKAASQKGSLRFGGMNGEYAEEKITVKS